MPKNKEEMPVSIIQLKTILPPFSGIGKPISQWTPGEIKEYMYRLGMTQEQFDKYFEIATLKPKIAVLGVSGTFTKPKRIDRDQMFIQIVKIVARRSTCARAQVGALIVKDNRIISTGYNGSPSGLPHCMDVGCLELDGEDGCQRTVHAEANAIAFAAKAGICTEGGSIYVTHSPCINCAKIIINAGIKEVVYDTPYRKGAGIELLEEAGIKIRQVKA